ncbi:MAG: hypothetical protein J0H22_14785 [Actinobacteria bacterium]|jgi:hypothetical protein|nr:hypothetical protein [Actinomycetota bacterium]
MSEQVEALDFDGFVAQPVGAVVGSADDAGTVWARAIRYPGCWKVVGYLGMRSDCDAWNTLEGGDGGTLTALYVDEALTRRPPSESSQIVDGYPERADRIRAQTEGLEPGWYITTGFFWHDDPIVIDGPISEFDAARLRRTDIERRSAGPILYLDVVETAPQLVG